MKEQILWLSARLLFLLILCLQAQGLVVHELLMYDVDEISPWPLTGADFSRQMHPSIKEFFPAAQPIFPFLLSESFINLCMPNHLHFQEVEVPKKEKEKRIAMLVNLYLASSLGQL